MATLKERAEQRPPPEGPAARRTPSPRRVQLAQILGFVAVVAALVGALGPAEPIRTTYSWPPPALPADQPTRLWYTPLLLAHRVPERLSARLPCHLAAPLPSAAPPLTVLATARYPDRTDGLAVTQRGRTLDIAVGTQVVNRVRLPAEAAGCAFDLKIEGGTWSLTGGPNAYAKSGRLEVMPTVNGLFSALDLRASKGLSVDIAVVPQSRRPVLRQSVAWLLAVVCAITALLLVSLEPRAPRARRAGSHLSRKIAGAAHPADGAVALVLLSWWVLSPVFDDDGWVLVRERAFNTSGGFSNYFDTLGGNLPLGYWLEWLEHWLGDATTTLIVLRVPALLCLATTWVICRWTLARMLGSPARRDATAIWALAAAFAVGALSWGMTLRPEPTVALLTAGVLACTVAFVERARAIWLALAIVLIALAVPAHPSGIVAVAPLVAAAPAIFRWARARYSVAATMVPAAIALLVTLATIGSDVTQRSTEAATVRVFGDATLSWRDELWRYQLLSFPPFGTGLRRASVALIALALIAYLFRPRQSHGHMDLASRALAIGLVALVFTPSKWPWHFGTLIALAAVAIATEVGRFRDKATTPSRPAALSFVWIAGAIVVAAWSWTPWTAGSSLDLRTLHWNLGSESTFSLTKLAVSLPVLALLGVGAADLLRRNGLRLASLPGRVAPWSVALVGVPLVAFTIGVLAADAIKTDSWTLTRQNLTALRGDQGCGLADTLVAPTPNSMRALRMVPGGSAPRHAPSWVPDSPVRSIQRFALGPVTSGKSATPWFTNRPGRSLGLFVAGTISPLSTLTLDFARQDGHRIRRVGSADLPVTEPRPADVTARPSPELVAWRFLSFSTDARRLRRADAVRLRLSGAGSIGDTLAVTAPVTYATRELSDTLRGTGTHTLTNPFVLPYFPCAREPQLGQGIVEVPTAFVGYSGTLNPMLGRTHGTFNGVLDLYPLIRLPLADPRRTQPDPMVAAGTLRTGLALYEADTRIPGAAIAPAVASSS